MNTIFSAWSIFGFDKIQNLYLCFSLVQIFLVILHYLQSYKLFSILMIHTLENLPKRPFSHYLHKLISKVDMISNKPVITSIRFTHFKKNLMLFSAILSKVIDFSVVHNLLFFIGLQIIYSLDNLERAHCWVNLCGVGMGFSFGFIHTIFSIILRAFSFLSHFSALSFIKLLNHS